MVLTVYPRFNNFAKETFPTQPLVFKHLAMSNLLLRRKTINFFLVVLAGAALLACNKESTTFGARLYHRTTSYFNGYYNANLLFQETVAKMEAAYPFPDVGFVEPMYFGDETTIQSYKSDFEKIIEKNDAVIFKHPNGSYVDNCRLLTGKSWFYQRDYLRALRNFKAVIDSFPESKDIPQAWFWTAQTHYQEGNIELAQTVLREQILEVDSLEISERLAGEIALFRVKLALDRDNPKEAAQILEENIEFIYPQTRKVRSHFLLGQLFAAAGQFPQSLEYFTEVTKSNSPYDIIFRAKLKIARLYVDFQQGADDELRIYEYLTALQKDPKNEDYLDQIFYEFALLELKKDSLHPALSYLNQSVRANRTNSRQKAMSYYKAGQIYFYSLRDYPSAQLYYDSAATAIQPKEPEYQEIKDLAATLKDYVTHIRTIHYQDSMLYLSKLPQDKLDAIVDSLVALEEKRRLEEEEKQKKALASEGQGNDLLNPMLQQQMDRMDASGPNAGAWYFDNPSAVTNGRLQFQQTWGQRANEDNWRRSKKNTITELNPDGAGDEKTASAEDPALAAKFGDRAVYYKDIPTTPEQEAAVKALIEEAMYRLGQIYQLKLNEPDSAMAMYERELDRFPYGEFNLPARYALYQLYKAKGNPLYQALESYIVNEHPQTIYAYLILGKDPRLLKQDIEDFDYAYTGLFSAYQRKQYETSLGFSEYLLAQTQFLGNPEINLAEVQYIRGMSYGYLGVQDSLRTILSQVISTYPEAAVTPVARKTLDFLEKGVPTVTVTAAPTTPDPATPTPKANDGNLADPANPKYQGFSKDLTPGDKVFVLMFVNKESVDKNVVNTKLAEFNNRLYKDANLRVFTFMYQQSHLLPYISQFKSIEDAAKYIVDLQKEPFYKEILKSEADEIFYITHSNFKVAYGQKRMEDYIPFYKNVLTKK